MIILGCLAFFMGLFLYLFVPVIRLYKRIEDASQWAETKAIVVDARIYRNKGFLSKFFNSKTYFYCQFKVDGKKFGSSNIGLFPIENAQYRGFISAIKAGSEIPVYFDKTRPHINCAIKPEDHATSVLVLKKLMVFLFFIVSTLFVLKGYL